jgi:hypothetical protein
MENFVYHFPNMRVFKFLLKKGETVPLHVHPSQYGTAYVLSGMAEITSYKILTHQDNEYQLELQSTDIVCQGEHQILTPINNGHKIVALEDTWFLDSFAPGKKLGSLSIFLEVLKQDDKLLLTRKIAFEDAKLPQCLIDNNELAMEIY